MKPRLWLAALVALALGLAACRTPAQSAGADLSSGTPLGTVSSSGSGYPPPLGRLKSLLRDEAARVYGLPAADIIVGAVNVQRSTPVGRDGSETSEGRIGSSPASLYDQGGWSASAAVARRTSSGATKAE